jgi:hypothetical protein
MDSSSTPHALQGCIGMFRGNGDRFQGRNNVNIQQQLVKNVGTLAAISGQPVPTPNEMDRIIAKEMTDLSLQERESAENDVHGIRQSRAEDPLALQNGLLHLQRHLDTMKKGTVYEEAEMMNRNYVTDHKFRLKFLRADLYDPKEAAERMIRFFELKKSLFGTEKLVKDITIDDLDEDDMETLRSGYMQLPPYTDMAGRTILIGMLKLREMKTVENAVSRLGAGGPSEFKSPFFSIPPSLLFIIHSHGWLFIYSWWPWNLRRLKNVGWFAFIIC